ncbi:MAG: glycine cleavage system aminomethyltransferase GcvT [Rhizobiales bacterium]|nr:glycine cleavage system aminomethyltransferase GcvT [Hyphomicrobiales bacterium]
MATSPRSEKQKPSLKRTALHQLHVELGAKLVAFAGYEMPVQYPAGVLAEHRHTREAAGLFDVSHMGQAFVSGPDHKSVAEALETMVPGEIAGLGLGRVRYTVLLNDEGGILDDLMVTRSVSPEDDGMLLLVVNAARKKQDYRHIAGRLGDGLSIAPSRDRALMALQGPLAAEVLSRHCPQASDLGFMTASSASFDNIDCHVSRTGYSGEDGFEISVAASSAEKVARALLSESEVAPIGLGARDTLRMEAGLCLYGNDIDETTSPIEADLGWVVSRRRREQGDFPGARRILAEIADGPPRRRVGLLPSGRAPARAGARILIDEREVGIVTSGGFGPSVNGPIAMGYMETALAAPGTEVQLLIRGKPRQAVVAELPLVPHRYFKHKA